jgi:hypothetical protein
MLLPIHFTYNLLILVKTNNNKIKEPLQNNNKIFHFDFNPLRKIMLIVKF